MSLGGFLLSWYWYSEIY